MLFLRSRKAKLKTESHAVGVNIHIFQVLFRYRVHVVIGEIGNQLEPSSFVGSALFGAYKTACRIGLALPSSTVVSFPFPSDLIAYTDPDASALADFQLLSLLYANVALSSHTPRL